MLYDSQYVVSDPFSAWVYLWRYIYVFLLRLGLDMKDEIIEGVLIVLGLVAWFSWVFYIIGAQ